MDQEQTSKLLSLMAPRLDRHLLLVLLAHAAAQFAGSPKGEEFAAARAQLLATTLSSAEGGRPEIKAARDASGSLFTTFFVVDDDGIQSMKKQPRELDEMRKAGGLTLEALKATTSNLAALLKLGKLLFEAGEYEQAAPTLNLYMRLDMGADGIDVEAHKAQLSRKADDDRVAAASKATSDILRAEEVAAAAREAVKSAEGVERDVQISQITSDLVGTKVAIKTQTDQLIKAIDDKLQQDLQLADRMPEILAKRRAAKEKNDQAVMWGRLVCDSLIGDWREAQADIIALRELLLDPATTVVERLWLLHNSLFYYFKKAPQGDTALLLEHLFSGDKGEREREKNMTYANTIQSAAPHFMRYVCVAAVLNKKKRSHFRRVVVMVEQELYQLDDPISQFVDVLCAKSDFKAASRLLSQCEDQLANDFFLCGHREEFMNNARMLLFEESLRIHQSLSIPSAAERLSLPVAQTELWLVNLIREAKIDATVDAVKQTINVKMASQRKSIWQHVTDRLDVVHHQRPQSHQHHRR